MKRTILILVIIIFWMILGIFLIKRDCCYNTTSVSSAITSPAKKSAAGNIFIIKDRNDFSARSPYHYRFLKSTFSQCNPSGNLENAINKLVSYLKGNGQRQLLVTGHFDENSKSNRNYLRQNGSLSELRMDGFGPVIL